MNEGPYLSISDKMLRSLQWKAGVISNYRQGDDNCLARGNHKRGIVI